MAIEADALPRPLVDASWLAVHADDVRIVDCRWYLDGRSGSEAFHQGHIPGAQWVDLDRELSGPPSAAAGRHPLPPPAQFARAMGRLGIGDTTLVVVYDDAAGSIAARLWWMLHVHAHPVAVLDGGLAAWKGALATGAASTIAAARFTARPWPAARFVEAENIGAGDVIIDARAPSRYAHGDPAIDPRPGHIPGARNHFWKHNLSGDRFSSARELTQRYRELGVSSGARTICYCGSGVTACHDLLALEIAGLADRAALYAGSWSQWGADHNRPARQGTDS